MQVAVLKALVACSRPTGMELASGAWPVPVEQ